MWLKRKSASGSAVGLSLKTQELYLLVFLARYLDLFTNFHSLYNSVMKVVYILASGYVVYLLRYREPFKSSYRDESKRDNFPTLERGKNVIIWLILPCIAVAAIFNEGNWTPWHSVGHYAFEFTWAFSIWLECVAILPQIQLLINLKQVENITSYYVASLGAYRALYIANWMYRYFTEPHYSMWIAWVAGAIQTIMYCEFFYYFYKSKAAGLPFVVLPH